jgi:hypothetical protein
VLQPSDACNGSEIKVEAPFCFVCRVLSKDAKHEKKKKKSNKKKMEREVEKKINSKEAKLLTFRLFAGPIVWSCWFNC